MKQLFFVYFVFFADAVTFGSKYCIMADNEEEDEDFGAIKPVSRIFS